VALLQSPRALTWTLPSHTAEMMVQQVMETVGDEERGRDLKCEICGKSEEIKRCAKCKVVAYC